MWGKEDEEKWKVGRRGTGDKSDDKLETQPSYYALLFFFAFSGSAWLFRERIYETRGTAFTPYVKSVCVCLQEKKIL